MKAKPPLTWLLITTALILTLNLAAVHYPFQVLLPLANALYLIFTMFLYGFLVIRLLYYKKKEKPGELGEFTAVFAVGMIFTTFFFYLLAWLKMLYPWTIILYYLAPLLFFLGLIKKKLAHPDQESEGMDKKAKPGWVDILKTFFQRPKVEYLVFLFPLIYAALPPSFYDSLAYHLGIPNLYLQNTGFIETPQFFYANTFIYYEILLIPAVFAGDLVPRLFHFLIGVIFILSAIDFAVAHFKITQRTILLLTIISMPMTHFLLTAVKNDLPSALFIFLGVCGVTRAHREKSLPGNLIIPAWFWGFAIGIKYTNIIPLAIFLLLYFIKARRLPIKQVVVFALIIAAVLSPLMLKNFVFTGNPVFPFFHRYFDNKLPYWDSSRFTLLEQDAKKLFYSVQDVLQFPFTLSFSELGSGGIVGPLFLMFLPFLAVKKERRWFLLVFSLLTLVVGANFKLSIRVWAIAFIFLAMYVTIAYEYLRPKIMKYLFFLIIGINVLSAFGLQEYLYRSFNLFSGKLDIEEYKALTFPTYKAIAYVNQKAPLSSRVLLAGEGKSYYLKRPYYVSSGYDFSILKKYLEKSSTPAEFIAALKADGIDYIIFNVTEFHRLQESYKGLTDEEFNRSLYCLKNLTPVFRDEADGVFVFRI